MSRPGPHSGYNFTVHISEFQDQDRINPRPNEKTESEYLLEEFLSPARLSAIAHSENLDQVTSLQMVVDTTENSLGNFGHYLPNLTELDLSNSVLTSVRDLGSSLAKLEIIWLTKCQLVDLDGLSTFYNLTELYLAYNHINNLNDLSMMDNLKILDLEANDIDDIDQILFIEMCYNLKNICLQHNPICSAPKPLLPFDPEYNYRQVVIKMLPQLQRLDDVDVSDKSQDFTNLDEDLQLLTDNIKYGVASDGDPERPGSSAGNRPWTGAVRRPGSAMRPRSAMSHMMFGRSNFGVRPGTASVFDRPPTAAEKAYFQLPNGRPGTGSSVASSDSAIEVDDFSKLTSGNILCGNPLRALRPKKSGGKTAGNSSNKKLIFHTSGYKTAQAKQDNSNMTDVTFDDLLEELKEWKVEFEGKKRNKVSISEEVNVLTLSAADEAIDFISTGNENNYLNTYDGAPENSSKTLNNYNNNSNISPERFMKKSSINIRRRQYFPISTDPGTSRDVLTPSDFNHDESYEDGDSGLASSRETDTPNTLHDYQSRGPLRIPASLLASKGSPHQMSIKPPLVPSPLKPSLENIKGDPTVRPKIKNAARPAKSTLDQMKKVLPPTKPIHPPPHKSINIGARPGSSMPSLSYEKFSSSGS